MDKLNEIIERFRNVSTSGVEACSRQAAIDSAIAAVKRAGYEVTHVELEDRG